MPTKSPKLSVFQRSGGMVPYNWCYIPMYIQGTIQYNSYECRERSFTVQSKNKVLYGSMLSFMVLTCMVWDWYRCIHDNVECTTCNTTYLLLYVLYSTIPMVRYGMYGIPCHAMLCHTYNTISYCVFYVTLPYINIKMYVRVMLCGWPTRRRTRLEL